MSVHVKYLLVGGGLASSHAARAIREIDSQGDLVLVGQDINRPYHRPPLSKEFLRGQMPRAEVFIDSSDWILENHVQLRTARRASRLDVGRNAVTLDNGEEISFDKLLLATGANAAPLRVPGANLPNLFYLRTLEDADYLALAIEKAKQDGRPHSDGLGGRGRALVIGAGLLGVETACSLKQLGLHVEIAAAGASPWESFAGATLGRCIARHLEKQGITLHLSTAVLRLEGDGRVQRAVLTGDKTVDCDLAIACVGVQVNKELLRNTPIAAEKSILIDDHCRTSVPRVFAAGDCATLLDPRFGKHCLLEHWQAAVDTGRVAGINMAGGDAKFDSVNQFDTQAFDFNVLVFGEARLVDRRIIRGMPSGDSPQFFEIGIAADGRIAQVIAIGPHSKTDAELAVQLVRQRFAVDGNEEMLKDPAIPLGQVLKPTT